MACLQRRLAELEGELQEETSRCKYTEHQLSDASLPEYERLSQGSLEPTLPARSGHNEPRTCTPPGIIYYDQGNGVPFQGEAPASNPLKKNLAIESWIRATENIVRPSSSVQHVPVVGEELRQSKIQTASTTLKTGVSKQELRRKFRGTYSAADFKVLYVQTMRDTQTPMDYFLQIEGSVYQGCCDHCEAYWGVFQTHEVFLSCP